MKFPVLLTVRPSRGLKRLLSLLYALAAAGVFFTPWPFWLRAGLLLAVAYGFWRDKRCAEGEAVRLMLKPHGCFRINDALEARIKPGGLCLPWWTVFEWQENGSGGGRSGRFILMPDSADAHSLRRLRMWLADGHGHGRHQQAAATGSR
jgi:hypothetical protein